MIPRRCLTVIAPPKQTNKFRCSIVVNSSPSSGILLIDPRRGVVLDTPFEFRCTGWVDDAEDLPLLYTFFYARVGLGMQPSFVIYLL